MTAKNKPIDGKLISISDKNMTKKEKPLDSQISIILTELEKNPLFFKLHNDNTSYVKNSLNSVWDPVVAQLNNEPGGPKFDLKQWRSIFSIYKNSARYRIRGFNFKNRDMSAFTPHQQKLLIILSKANMNQCRGCFQINNDNNSSSILFPLYENLNDCTILTEKAKIYSKFIKFKVNKSDMLPNFLCEKCWNQCKEWNDFQIICNNSTKNNGQINSDNEIKINTKEIKLFSEVNDQQEKEIKINNTESISNNIEEIIIKQEPPEEFEIFNQLPPIEIKQEDQLNDFTDINNFEIKTTSPEKLLITGNNDNIVVNHADNISTTIFDDNLDVVINNIGKNINKIKKEENYDEINEDCEFYGNDNDENSNLSNDFINMDNEIVIEKSGNNINEELSIKKDFKYLECDICSKKFTQKDTILNHLLTHCKKTMKRPRKTIKKQFACFECGKTFIKQSTLKTHLKIHNSKQLNDNNYSCKICKKVFQSEYRLQQHSKRHDPKSKCTCLDCGKIYASSDELSRHQKTHMEKLPYPCHLCAKSFKKLAQLNIHGKVHENAVKIYCEICRKSFIYSQILERHRIIHLIPSDTPELDEERYMNEEGPQPCTMCYKIYKSKKSLRDHVYTCHKPLERRYLCAKCGKNFLKPNLLKTHMLSHVVESNYGCTICDKRFKCEKRLQKHQRWHDPTAIKFICTECGKEFTTSAQLVTHSRIHTGERPYVCSICKKSFKTISQLNTHNRIHTGARPFSCNICHMTFTYLDVLKRHKRIHIGNM